MLGTILPLAAGTLLTMAYNKPFFPMGVAAGTALAPTSVGIALRLLGEAGVLKEDFGQAAGGGWSWFLDEVRKKWLAFLLVSDCVDILYIYVYKYIYICNICIYIYIYVCIVFENYSYLAY